MLYFNQLYCYFNFIEYFYPFHLAKLANQLFTEVNII